MKLIKKTKLMMFMLIWATSLIDEICSLSAEETDDLDVYDGDDGDDTIVIEKTGMITSNRFIRSFVPSCTNCICGIRAQTRIVNGQKALKGEFPWVAHIILNNEHHCGATLITKNHILTVAHCVWGRNIDDFIVRLQDDSEYKMSRIYIHSGYAKSNRSGHDIALIELDRTVYLNSEVLTACLPIKKYHKEYVGKTGVAIGWGFNKEYGLLSTDLRKVDLPIMSDKECRSTGYDQKRITSNIFCAGYLKGKSGDTCYGDSGGGLFVKNHAGITTELVGMVSFGRGCARPQLPGVYTRVLNYRKWIERRLNTCLCPPLKM